MHGSKSGRRWGRWRARTARAAALVVAAIGVQAAPARAQESSVCLSCHGDASLWQTREDPERYLVEGDALQASVHGALECLECHRGMTFPHPEDRPVASCATCHATQARRHAESLHGQAAARGDRLAPSCADCHGNHDVLPSRNARSRTAVMNIPFLCGECHQDDAEVMRRREISESHILENYTESIHGEGLFRAGLTVTAVCTSCHTSHFILPHEDPRSSIHIDNIAATCQQCHGRIEEVHAQVIEGRLWEEEPHKVPACVDCHQPHEIRRVFYDTGVANRECLRCHEDPALEGTHYLTGEVVSMTVDSGAYDASVHGNTGCAQCHTDVSPTFDERPCETVAAPVDCAICHAEPVEQYQRSAHGSLHAAGDPDAPSCQDCHTTHATLAQTQPASPTFTRNVPTLCARCHREGEKAAVRVTSDVPIVRSYEMSIHGKGLLESGLLVTATCTDCHGAHLELPPEDPASRVNPDNLVSTCGECHHGIEEEFRRSIHWPEGGSYVDSEKRLPTCEDCHTAHTISRADRDDFRQVISSQCGDCHAEETESFFDTYHGKVSRLGGARAAKCHDCHGAHDILPPHDPASTLSRANVVETCAQCHPGANRRFAGYLTHATHHDRAKYPWLFWSFWGMTGLLVGTLTFALAHTGAWLWRLWRSPEQWRHDPAEAVSAGRLVYRRFTAFQRTLHIVMIMSFMTLAATGMALKFSYMGWAGLFARLVGGFEAMGVLHRVGAVALIAIFVIHLVDVTKQKKRSGRTWREYIFLSPDSLMFNGGDLADLKGSFRWFFGKGPRPAYGRFTYWEKFDYFAVFWGMFVIGSTGLFLWFPEFFTLLIPGSLVNVATIIHSDEALLAVAFIFTIHFFNTHFRLDKFPMDPVIFTGTVSLEELKRDKPREYERMVAEGKLEERMVEPYPKEVETGFRIFGFTMLGIGLVIIALILYSVLFGYR
ncbi:MAG: cytochrome c3 family protein [Gemmatimonadota bacterium]|nr:cytochrome c3 family protein [Gemmatimonadota bacterium]